MGKSNLVRIITEDSDKIYDPQEQFYANLIVLAMIIMIPWAMISPSSAGRFLTTMASIPIDVTSQITGTNVREVFGLPAKNPNI